MSTLAIKKLTVETADKATVVKSVSLDIKPGEVHLIMGRNGSGKSSLVNAIIGHPKYVVTAGKIMLGRKNILDLKPEERARHGLFLSLQHVPSIDGVTLAYFMHKVHSSLTGKTVPIMEYYANAVEKAKELGISEKLLKRPLHAGLSGGEKKQSEILQLHMLKPKFAFLDEIDSGVDLTTMKSVFAGMKKLQDSGTALILITHYPEVLQHVKPDFVHIMKDGTITETGSSDLVKRIVRDGL